ncbi:MAG TPA: hypothetical protein VK939_16160 [Longimicrobiales bacterium]|nr:hypothetical protein [Longimicrobiales bacterium]
MRKLLPRRAAVGPGATRDRGAGAGASTSADRVLACAGTET